MSTLFAILKGVATLAPLMLAFIRWYKDLTEVDQKEFISKAHLVFSGLKEAETKESKQDAARKIQDLIRSL